MHDSAWQLRSRRFNPACPLLSISCGLLLALNPPQAAGQAPGVTIERDEVLLDDAPLVTQASALRKLGKLMDAQRVSAELESPRPAPISLPAPSPVRIEPRALAAKGRAALVRVGWYYREKHSKQWHVNLADGYAIADGGVVATCHHCVAPEEQEMKDGFLIASDADGTVFPVTAILAADKALDAAIIRIEGGKFPPLPLNTETAPGDPVFVFSDPMGTIGYFTSGMLNRFFWLDGTHSTNPANLEGQRNLRIHVSCDWAPGSSGAALLDACGNAIGHVSVIDPVIDDDPPPAQLPAAKNAGKSPPPPADHSVLMILHETVPARGVKMLADAMKAAADQP